MSNAFLTSHFSLLISDGVRFGGLAQLARAPALQAGGQRFESVILHDENRIGEANPNLDTEAKAMMSCGSQEIFDILTQARL